MRLLLPIFALSISFTVSALAAEPRIKLIGPFLSGPERVEKALKETKMLDGIPASQRGFVEVPLDYKNPSAGSTKVFYKFAKPIDPAKPSAIFFYGGPGGSSAAVSVDRNLKNTNIIYMDQRGSGFSYLPTLEQQRNSAFFSSEFTARDGERVLRHLGLKRVGVYGHSYGTIVATEFSHLFPEMVSGLILEGTIFDEFPGNEASKARLAAIQKFFDGMPPEMQERVLRLSNGGLMVRDWFSRVVKGAMYGENFEKTVMDSLTGYFKQSDEGIASDLGMDLSDENLNRDSSAFAAIMYHQIACQEMGLGDPKGGWASYFEGRKLVPSGNEDAPSCLELTGMKERMGRLYSASRYPLHIPVTYIQGETDGATPLAGALQHYRLVAKGQAQFLMAPKFGHTPALEFLNEAPDSTYKPERRAEIALIVESALRGEKISAEQAGTVGWKLKAK